MMLWELFVGFLKVGCFAFGGAYGAIPLIRDVVMSYGWLTEAELTWMIAVSESTPGPIMVNLATYVGAQRAGLAGALVSTAAVVLPSFLVILLVMGLFKALIKNKYFQAMLRGMKFAVTGVVLATGLYMLLRGCAAAGLMPDWKSLVVTALLGLGAFGLPLWKKKSVSPILLVTAGAALGWLFRL